MLLTELFNISHPYLLGKSVDGLLNGSWYWLVLLAISYFGHVFFNYKRMVYDTKIYTKIYNNIVLNFLKKSDTSVSTKIARTDMANDIVNVLEGYVHYYIATIVTIVGSIGFIYSENWIVGVMVSIATLLIILSVRVFYKKIRQSVRLRNNHYEKKVVAIEAGQLASISFFNRKRKLDIYESTLQGKNWFLVGLIKNLFLFTSVILLVLTAKHVTVGSIMTIYSYVNNFLISLMSIPISFEMYSRLNDIVKRMD